MTTTDDRLAEIRARADAARQAAASGTTGTPPNIDGLSVNDALDIFHESAEDVPWLLAEVERLREYIDRMPYPSDMDELRAERDRAREDCGHQKAMRAHAEEERDRFIRLYKKAAATVERVRAVADRMAEREWALTPAATWRDALRAALEGDEP